ncbi:hypothetical protein K470DRAFT_265639 [Piedraia hortae CBS 480.64]|uniref:Uncharacterized protein n=1 Tax=Piedraia hortae CBS 480.64 TaxID=1314780 RepID=A0A6A7BUI9_9PEZI|nr:hypothetical protein K470DRAFT_265639 [Piedraia hortae CBS 480.64]
MNGLLEKENKELADQLKTLTESPDAEAATAYNTVKADSEAVIEERNTRINRADELRTWLRNAQDALKNYAKEKAKTVQIKQMLAEIEQFKKEKAATPGSRPDDSQLGQELKRVQQALNGQQEQLSFAVARTQALREAKQILETEIMRMTEKLDQAKVYVLDLELKSSQAEEAANAARQALCDQKEQLKIESDGKTATQSAEVESSRAQAANAQKKAAELHNRVN